MTANHLDLFVSEPTATLGLRVSVTTHPHYPVEVEDGSIQPMPRIRMSVRAARRLAHALLHAADVAEDHEQGVAIGP